MFDGSRWITYTTADGLMGGQVNHIAFDEAGQVWVATEDGVSRFDGQVWTAVAGAPVPARAIAFDRAGRAWIGGVDGVSVLDGTGWTAYPTAGDFDFFWINAMTTDPGGNIWVASGGCFMTPEDCSNAGLSKFDGRNWSNYLQTYLRDFRKSGPVFGIAFDQDGTGWVGLNSEVRSFDPRTLPAGATHADAAWTIYPLDGEVHAIATGRAGQTWFGATGGVARWAPASSAHAGPTATPGSS
jgi:ligand-binding sensor domain-containing protein